MLCGLTVCHLVGSLFRGSVPTEQLAQGFPSVSPSMLAFSIARVLHAVTLILEIKLATEWPV